MRKEVRRHPLLHLRNGARLWHVTVDDMCQDNTVIMPAILRLSFVRSFGTSTP